MGTTKHIFKDCEVICERSKSSYYCRVYKNGKQVLAVNIPEAENPSEAAKEARNFIV